MALAERATLVAELRLDDKMSGGLAKAGRGLSKFEGVASRTGQGLKTLGGNLVKIGAAATIAGAALAGAAIKAGISSLAELEDATTAVDGALKAVGKTGQTTSAEIAGWANDIEASVQAAFDDKAIVAGAATLLRYGKVSTKSLRPAMVVMTDLAAKTGDVGSAASLLAKAMAAPANATRLLRQVGVTLTADEEKRIKTLVKLGRLEDAQAIILGKVAAVTKDAAAASKGPYNDALNELADITEDTQRALAEGFLPVIKDVAAFLRTELVKPEVKQGIKDLGKGLAGAFQAAVSFAKQIPWGAVAGAARGIAGFAKQALDLFNMMPDWAKTILIGGFVANKLTGGLVKDLASGLIKGVLGMTAGVVNVTGGVVNVPGGGLPGGGKGGAPLAPAAGGFALSSLLPAAAIAGVGAAAVAASLWLQEEGRKRAERGDTPETSAGLAASGRPDLAAWAAVAEGTRTVMNTGKPTGGGGRGDKGTAAEVKRLGDRQALAARIVAAGGVASAARIQAIMDKNVRTSATASANEVRRLGVLDATTRSGLESVTSAANATTAAVNKFAGFTIPAPVVTVTVTGFTVRTLNRKTTVDKSINPVRPEGRGPLP